LSVIFVGIVFFITLLFRAEPAFAGASIFISPGAPKVNVGDVFEVSVYVKSTDQAINACEAEISFPTDKLEVLSVSSKNSIFNLMVQNPTFSNKTGAIGFSGVVLNPGFTGASGRMITLSFKAKNPGTAKLNFNSAQVLANDGLGTDILSVANSALVTIGQKVPEPVPAVPAPTVEEETAKAKAAAEAAAEAARQKALQEATSTAVTTTGAGLPAAGAPTSAIVLLKSVPCTYDQLPTIFVKIGGLSFGIFGLLLFLIIICIGIAIYAFAKAKYLEKQHHENLHKMLRKQHHREE